MQTKRQNSTSQQNHSFADCACLFDFADQEITQRMQYSTLDILSTAKRLRATSVGLVLIMLFRPNADQEITQRMQQRVQYGYFVYC